MALVRARTEINDQEEVARLAAAKREALELLIVKLRNEGKLQAEEITSVRKELSETEKTRLVEQAAAENLKESGKWVGFDKRSVFVPPSSMIGSANKSSTRSAICSAGTSLLIRKPTTLRTLLTLMP